MRPLTLRLTQRSPRNSTEYHSCQDSQRALHAITVSGSPSRGTMGYALQMECDDECQFRRRYAPRPRTQPSDCYIQAIESSFSVFGWLSYQTLSHLYSSVFLPEVSSGTIFIMQLGSSLLLAVLAGLAQAQSVTPSGFTPSASSKLDVFFNSTMVTTPGQVLSKTGKNHDRNQEVMSDKVQRQQASQKSP